MAYSVAQRTREVCLRVARGARPKSILKLVLSGGVRLAFLGLALGAGAGLALAPFRLHLHCGVTPVELFYGVDSTIPVRADRHCDTDPGSGAGRLLCSRATRNPSGSDGGLAM